MSRNLLIFYSAHSPFDSSQRHRMQTLTGSTISSKKKSSLLQARRRVSKQPFMTSQQTHVPLCYTVNLTWASNALMLPQGGLLPLYDFYVCWYLCSYGCWLNGTMLEWNDFTSFCEMCRRSYVAPPAQSIMPPPGKITQSVIDPGPSIWASWSPKVLATYSPQPSTSADPWTVDPSNINDAVEKVQPKPHSKYFDLISQCCSYFYCRPNFLAQGLLLPISHIPCLLQHLGGLPRRMARQTVSIHTLSRPILWSQWPCTWRLHRCLMYCQDCKWGHTTLLHSLSISHSSHSTQKNDLCFIMDGQYCGGILRRVVQSMVSVFINMWWLARVLFGHDLGSSQIHRTWCPASPSTAELVLREETNDAKSNIYNM